MHVHETNPTKTVITIVIFTVIIIIGLITLSKPRLSYSLTLLQTVALANSNEGFVTPDELKNILNQSAGSVFLIDIRNSYDFARGHLSGAENISAVELISKENIPRLQAFKNAGQSVLLYGNTIDEANGPFMVLRQIGFDNVKVLLGGYDYYKEGQNMRGDSYGGDTNFMGAPDYDFAEKAATASTVEKTNSEAKINITFGRKKKTTVIQGGC